MGIFVVKIKQNHKSETLRDPSAVLSTRDQLLKLELPIGRPVNRLPALMKLIDKNKQIDLMSASVYRFVLL